MPAKIWLTVLVIVLLLSGFASAVRITAVEYFFDNDPGRGNGTPVTITPADSVGGTFYPRASTAGFHVLFLRSCDELGNWGIPSRTLMWAEAITVTPSHLARVEYFFDTDPGVGNGITVGTFDQDTLQRTITVSCAGLALGYHTFYLRVIDQYGNVNTPINRPLWVCSNPYGGGLIIGAEYFFDSDPGLNQGYAIPVIPGSPDTVSCILDLSDLSAGYHMLYLRVKDNSNSWSALTRQSIWVEKAASAPPPIVAAEYFIDNEPGFGRGNPITIVPAETTTVSFTADFSGQAPGYHNFYLRVRDSLGNWGFPNAQQVNILQPPSVPRELTIQYNLAQNRAVLNWLIPLNSTVTSYQVYRDTTGYYSPPTQGRLMGTIIAPTTTYTDTSAIGRYFYRVTASN